MSGSGGKNARHGWFGRIAEAFGEVSHGALTDIRQKLVEEAWFGRAVTPEARERTDWDGLCERLSKERGHQPERSQEHDHDLDP